MASSIRLPLRRLVANPIANPLLFHAQRQTPSCSQTSHRCQSTTASPTPPGADTPPSSTSDTPNPDLSDEVRLPRAVQAVYLKPLKRQAEYGVPSCDLQLRSYSIRNLEFFSDFALRTAYYLGLAASGPVPLPRIVERWTVPRASFIHKKSQENYERKTLRRLIQIKDGHPETVELWLAFLQKHAYYGIGMKANVWNYEKLGLGATMDKRVEDMRAELDKKWDLLVVDKQNTTVEKAMELVNKESFRVAAGGWPKPKKATHSQEEN